MSNFHGLGPCKGRHSTTCIEESVCAKILRSHTVTLFFHEYGRRVGMVPRSSLKEGKNRQMVEKKDKDNPTNKKQPQTTAHRPSLHHLVVFPLC